MVDRIGAFLLLAAGVQAQNAAFEVASIKLAAARPGEGGNRSRIDYSPNSFTARNVGLKDCIQWAYSVSFDQVSGLEPSESYDIFAKSGEAVPVSKLREMVQNLLRERFNLKLHRETKTIPVYALTIGKRGPKLPEPKDEGILTRQTESLPRIENSAFVFYNVSMSDFAKMLHQLRGIDLPVQDRTGIQGIYDITLKNAPEATRQGDVPLLFSLIEEQLGLKLVPGKGPMEMLVIEHAEKPSGN
jgi:uncharacterized protein (TIGR03435 family)